MSDESSFELFKAFAFQQDNDLPQTAENCAEGLSAPLRCLYLSRGHMDCSRYRLPQGP